MYALFYLILLYNSLLAYSNGGSKEFRL